MIYRSCNTNRNDSIAIGSFITFGTAVQYNQIDSSNLDLYPKIHNQWKQHRLIGRVYKLLYVLNESTHSKSWFAVIEMWEVEATEILTYSTIIPHSTAEPSLRLVSIDNNTTPHATIEIDQSYHILLTRLESFPPHAG